MLFFNQYTAPCVQTYLAGKTFPSKSDFDLDEKVLKVLSMIKTQQDGEENGAKPQEHIFNRSIARHEKDGGNSKVYSNVLAAAEDLAISIALSTQEQYPQQPLDTVAVANNITYYADGEDLYYNYSWTWGDGHGDTIERIYSAAETEDQMLQPEPRGVANDTKDQSEPYTPPRKVCLNHIWLHVQFYVNILYHAYIHSSSVTGNFWY